MEREVWTRAGMVVSVLALVMLISVTPILIGRPPAQLETLPLLIVGMPKNESYFIVYLGAAFQAYRYAEARIAVNGTDPAANRTLAESEIYALQIWVPAQVPSTGNLTIHSYLVDQLRNYFEYNVTVRADLDAGRTVLVFGFPDEKSTPGLEVERYPPAEDFRWPMPQRGTVP